MSVSCLLSFLFCRRAKDITQIKNEVCSMKDCSTVGLVPFVHWQAPFFLCGFQPLSLLCLTSLVVSLGRSKSFYPQPAASRK